MSQRASRFILSLSFLALALAVAAQEGAETKKSMPVEQMVKVIADQPVLANNSFITTTASGP
jgi:type IV secretory pathway VirB2 component (pilin)